MRITRAPFVIAALALATFIATPAFAVILASKTLNNTNFGWNSNVNGTEQQAADDLTLSTAGTANQLTWWGFNQNGVPSANFRVRLFTTVGGQPNSVPFYDQTIGLLTGVDTGLTNNNGNHILQYTSPIPAVALSAGTPYWLMIASNDVPIWTWSHANAGPPGNDQFHRDGDGTAWRSLIALGFQNDQLEQSFRLEGIVPEPASIGCAATMLALSLGRRRHR